MVVSNVFYFHPYLGKWSNLAHSFQMGWFNHQLDFYITRISQNMHMLHTRTNILHSKMGPISPRGSSGCVGDGRSSPFGPLERWHGHHGGGAGCLDFCHRRLPTMNPPIRVTSYFCCSSASSKKNPCQGQKALLLRFNPFFFPHGVPASSSKISSSTCLPLPRLFAMPWVNWWIAIFSEWRRNKTTWPTLERS